MEESVRFDNILKLGKRLVEELGLDQSVDTLGRWMAHYIAELIDNAETACEESRYEKSTLCANAILELWKYHSTMPKSSRPFQGFESIIRTLESFDTENTASRYFWLVRKKASKDQKNSESASWLDVADSVDQTARVLIRFCLACAARDAVDKSKEWIALAQAAAVTDDGYLSVIRLITHEVELNDEDLVTDENRNIIEDRIKRLKEFENLAATLSDHLRAKLDLTDNNTLSSE
ncbi:MAG: hypothetical protein HGA41_00095 [Syntrophaceae bacterium]|nr:hypothetical protein [Syntrophaceae bacterium]